jgi:hypothetical protein
MRRIALLACFQNKEKDNEIKKFENNRIYDNGHRKEHGYNDSETLKT